MIYVEGMNVCSTDLESDVGIEEELLLDRVGEMRVDHDACRDVLGGRTVRRVDLQFNHSVSLFILPLQKQGGGRMGIFVRRFFLAPRAPSLSPFHFLSASF